MIIVKVLELLEAYLRLLIRIFATKRQPLF